MRKNIPHLYRDQRGTFYFRATISGKTLKRSLHTKIQELATMRASSLNWHWSVMAQPKEPNIEEILKAAQEGRTKKFDVEFADGTKIKGINSDDDARRAGEIIKQRGQIVWESAPNPQNPSNSRANALSGHGRHFSKLIPAYILERSLDGGNRDKTLEDKESTFRTFAEHFGDLPVGQIDKATAVAFKSLFVAKKLSAGRINTKISHMSEFFSYAIGHGEAQFNPFVGLRVPKNSQAVESFDPFTTDDLARIFNPETYPAYALKNKPHFHWLPFLLLYTGARPEELASLKLDQIRREQGIDFFSLKGGKNTNSVRKIPFHKAVTSSGFMKYLNDRRAADPAGMLFPKLHASKNGYSKNVSRRFNETYLPTIDIRESTKRLYSFRATFITRMSELNVNTAMLMALVGHFEQDALDLSAPHFKNYQGAKKIAALKDIIDAFDVVLSMAF